MQSEPSAVPQYTPAVDSSQANLHPTQHGNDLNDGPVSGSLDQEEIGDQSVLESPVLGAIRASVNEDRSTPLTSPARRVIQHENAGIPGKRMAELNLQVVASNGQSNLPLEALPNEVLTHILSHLPPQSLSAITQVSRRFHALVTTPHAWRIAFSRFFAGPQAMAHGRRDPADQEDLMSDRRYFARLTALASWRSEYILRTRLMRSLSRGKPAQFSPSKKHGTVRSANARNGSAVVTYTSQLLLPVSHLHGSFNTGNREPTFIHGAAEQGLASASDPSAVKISNWGLSDHQMFRHFADIFPGDAPYGLGAGEMIGVPNSMDVSQPYGMIYGEGCPNGRSYFISTTEQRGRFLLPSELGSHPNLGIPAVSMITNAICSVWIAKSSSILKTTGGLMAMMTGSSTGILSAYSLGSHPTYEKRFEPGQATAKWVLSPGVPIIGIAVDGQYSLKRHSQQRIWAVALNALGEIYYLTDLPRQPNIPSTAKLNAEQLDELAWKTGRSVRWELLELSRRKARPDIFSHEPVDGSYSPRSSSDSMELDPTQICAETKEIEKFLLFKPKHFRNVCEGWNMRCDLHVDFAGDDARGAGESVLVIARGGGDPENASIRRYLRTASTSGLSSSASTPQFGHEKTFKSLFGGPVHISNPTSADSLPPSRSSTRSVDLMREAKNEWRVSNFTFGEKKSVEITTTALDNSTFATLLADEDPLLTLSGTSFSSATASPMLPHMAQPRSTLEVPGQRARYLAVGTNSGMVYVWDIRALAAQHADAINSISPLQIIQTESPQISCVALTSLYLVHGGNDGLVQAWDPLASSTRPIRTINSRFSTRARRRLVQAEATMLGVGNNYFATGAISLDPDPTSLRGMVSLGSHLRYWSYSSSAVDQYKSNKRRVRRSLRGSNGAADGQRFTSSGRGLIQDFIEDERIELERQQIADSKERAHLSARFGVDLLGPDIDEEQLLAYAQLLSEEAYMGDTAKRGDQTAIASSVVSTSPSDVAGPSSFGVGDVSSSSSPYQDPSDENVDDDIAEAIRLSLLDEKATTPPIDLTPSIPIKYAKGLRQPRHTSKDGEAEGSQRQEMDDLEFAIQLSLAEEKSRDSGNGEEWEEFPTLAPGPLSSSVSSGKGKGKAKAV
ncbi:hypothetical protein N7462_005248 [Penicillium macrosclerotiorum]|uniref:uncharacterized protein n=1 Tax=Penicillium macrosclerotiorum TaxID=303699 RepID=UPI0025472A6B|nr:uncharacterized protein N7462_005248 [Penicillium macrosclerotiorum]KAJ5690856.1 hypothetical protein N7462_005248 [Penicillium macrosclerotiorum]